MMDVLTVCVSVSVCVFVRSCARAELAHVALTLVSTISPLRLPRWPQVHPHPAGGVESQQHQLR